jgi:hypothetical protein
VNRTVFLIVIVFVTASCAAAPESPAATGVAAESTSSADVAFMAKAFRTPDIPEVEWVAWTSRGFEADGELIAPAGKGCLPVSGWPDVVAKLPGEPHEFWLYGTKPSMDAESLGPEGDEVVVDCVVGLDGTTRSASSVDIRFGEERPNAQDNFGWEPAPWRQANQSPRVTLLTPMGPAEWVLSESRRQCWLQGDGDAAWSACLPTPGEPGLELKRWEPTPEGMAARTTTLELPIASPGTSRVWLERTGNLVATSVANDTAKTQIWVKVGAGTSWSAISVDVPGEVTSAAFVADVAHVLVVDFDAARYQVVSVRDGRASAKELAEEVRPTTLHVGSDGTLWGAGHGEAWRLALD